MPEKRSYAAGSFELLLDGEATSAYLKSVEGGHVKTKTIDEAVGASIFRIKHQAISDIEPFSLELGMAGSQAILHWIQNSWRQSFIRRSGQVTHADFDLFQTFQCDFYDALITEIGFPALDGSSKDTAYLKLKFQPQMVTWKKLSSDDRVSGTISPNQKKWVCSSFRLTIDGVDGMQYANKIDAFTVKQGVKALYTGPERFPQLEPTKIDFPNLTGTIALECAGGLIKWHEQCVQNGQSDTKAEKTGSLELLSPDKKQTLFRLNLYEVGLVSAQIQQSQANATEIKRVKFDLYVGRMDLDGGG